MLDAKDFSKKHRRDLAMDKNTKPATLLQLVDDEDVVIRYSVIKNPNTPIEVLFKVAERSAYERHAVAQNPSAPTTLLEKLATDSNFNVRTSVAGNKNTPPSVLLLLSDDETSPVQEMLAQNPSTPPEVLVKLTNNTSNKVCEHVAMNPHTPPGALLKLTTNTDLSVRQRVAVNPNTPVTALLILVEDERWDVRYFVAQNPTTPPAVLERLACDSCSSSMGIFVQVMQNSAITQEILQSIYYNLVKKDALELHLATELLARDVQLEQTELSALVAYHGEEVARLILKKGLVAEGSILAKQLLQLGIPLNYHAKENGREGYGA